MKKSLLALAVLGAFAGAASAQSSVTIYGVVDTGFTHIDQGSDAAGDRTTNGISSGGNAASRIGFKGLEDLGNGLKAEFVLENGINTDDGSAANGDSAFSRLAFVGLNGGFGKVRLGRQNNAVKEFLGKVDTFGAAGIVNAHDFIAGGGIPQRQGNMVTWQSANYGGFSGSLDYVFGEEQDDTSSNSGWGGRLGYANGPLNVQFVYQNQNYDGAFAADDQQFLGTAGTADDVDDEVVMVGATYDFGVAKLHGIYGERKFDGAVTTGLGSFDDVKIRTGLIGVTVPFGASAVRAEYIKNENRDIDDADSDVFALSYTYAMSKRTTLYATYVRTDNDDGSALGIGGPDFGAVVAGDNASAVAVGINHKF